MSKNKSARQELERLYGKECFIDKLHLREETQKRYTGKGQFKRMKQLTYHHIKMRKDGGNRTMKKKDIIDVIVIALFILILAVYDVYISADNELKSNKINELTNKVEQQIELIDALQQ